METPNLAAQPTVLVAEDDRNIRDVIHSLLTDEGFTALLAVDGQDALDLALSRRIDAILLDLQMPILDGEGFCKAYRGGGGQAPVVLPTASAGDIIDKAEVSCGASGYIDKCSVPQRRYR